jgi:hypothetical protein
MRITKRQLQRLIKEETAKVLHEQHRKGDPEYDRGYDDGLGRKPVADNANDAYDEGYEDGEMDAESEETEAGG